MFRSQSSFYTTYVCEYIWLGGNGEIRSKTKVMPQRKDDDEHFPSWNFDGSSTEQAPADGNTEVVLRPVAMFKDPLRSLSAQSYCVLVLCDTYDTKGNPLPTNHRFKANDVFKRLSEELCWFGLEQEYFIRFNNKSLICENNGTHYCGQATTYAERQIVEQHLKLCIEANLSISGINAEVATCQWEFQIGPVLGIQAADQVIIARYLLEKVAEKFDATIDYSPKLADTANGSGCHINFSTELTRNAGGMNIIEGCMEKLQNKHVETMSCYGSDNYKRLTGKYETSSYDKFTWGIGTRNTSVRIPTETHNFGFGYFEDRRPAANIDPYLATSTLAKICCLDEE